MFRQRNRKPDWSFGWNHDQMTDFPVLKLDFPDNLHILKPTVEPDLAWVVKKQKTTCILIRRTIQTVLQASLSLPCASIWFG